MNIQDGILHVLGHPNLPLKIEAAPEDAQLQNCRNFCLLLQKLAIPFKYYGIEGSEIPEGGEFIDCKKALAEWKYGNTWHKTYNQRLSKALQKNIAVDDRPQWIISLYGAAQSDILTQDLPVIEAMLGYDHCWTDYRVFPSYAHQQHIYTVQKEFTWETRFFDTVIPHFIDLKDYPPFENKQDYLLYLGRNAEDKGVAIAEECAAELKMPLKKVHKGAYGEEKAKLLAEASAVLMPTLYLEPFGYVAIEAQMCGTPVITTDWGAFAETVKQGINGYRCRTLAEFKKAVKLSEKLNRKKIRELAIKHYTLDAVAHSYESYFKFVWNIHKYGGYYANDAFRAEFY